MHDPAVVRNTLLRCDCKVYSYSLLMVSCRPEMLAAAALKLVGMYCLQTWDKETVFNSASS